MVFYGSLTCLLNLLLQLHCNGMSRVKQDACYTGITRDAGADSFIPTVCFAD